MTNESPRRRRSLVSRALVCAALLGVCTAGVSLSAGCAGETATPVSPSPSAWVGAAAAPAGQEELVRSAFDDAAAALSAGDLAAWRAALPVDEDAAGVRRNLDGVFAHLAPLRPRAAAAVVRPVPGRAGYYTVRFTGAVGRAGPRDRILAERVLQLREAFGLAAAVGDETVSAADPATASSATAASAALPPVRIVADDTPAAVLRQGVMAFHRPRLLSVPGVAVVYEKSWRLRAAELAGHAAAARAHVARLYGVNASRTVALFVYGSRAQVMDTLGAAPGVIDSRIKYFSHPAARAADELWAPTDVGVVAPALNGSESWAPVMLEHEIAHAYTMDWFYETAHAPDFLQEGLAVAAESSHDWSSLQAALADEGLPLPLPDAIAVGDIWSGRPTEEVRVLYSAAGSLVGFVRHRWGATVLRRWVRDVADSDLSAESIADLTERHLDMRWTAFELAWRAYVYGSR